MNSISPRKLPKTFQIDGKRWFVKVGPLPEEFDGETDWAAKTITVVPNPSEPFDEILLHEVLHACIGKEVDLYVQSQMDELLVTLLAPRLLSALKQLGCWK